MTWDERIERMRKDLAALSDVLPSDEAQDWIDAVKVEIDGLEEFFEGELG